MWEGKLSWCKILCTSGWLCCHNIQNLKVEFLSVCFERNRPALSLLMHTILVLRHWGFPVQMDVLFLSYNLRTYIWFIPTILLKSLRKFLSSSTFAHYRCFVIPFCQAFFRLKCMVQINHIVYSCLVLVVASEE
jgi:hypothetical protein